MLVRCSFTCSSDCRNVIAIKQFRETIWLSISNRFFNYDSNESWRPARQVRLHLSSSSKHVTPIFIWKSTHPWSTDIFLSRRALTCYLSWAMSHPLIRFTLRCYPRHKWNGWLGHFSFLHQYRLGSQDCPCNGYSVLSCASWNLAWIYHSNNEKIFTFSHHCIVTDFPITCSGWLYYGITICSLH